jgi:hypothetical protein
VIKVIDFNLDKEDGIELESLVGEIKITDGNNSIYFQDAYVDSIFEALLKGIADLKGKNKTSIDLIEESGNFDFELVGDRLTIIYLKNVLYFDRSTFLNNLLLSTDKLLREIKDIQCVKTSLIINNIMLLKEQITGNGGQTVISD